MNGLIKTMLVSVLTATCLFAQQNATHSAQIDTLLQNQKKMLRNQSVILKNVKHPYVLQGKKAGIAFNPMLALAGSASQQLILSAAFSLFKFKGSEIIFPIYYNHSYKKNDPRDVLTADVQYRKFFNKERPGFFASAGLRVAYLKGKKYNDYADPRPYPQSNEPYDPVVTSVTKFGLYFGIGYRYFSRSGLYWGADMVLGTYFSDNTNTFDDTFMDASRILFDASFLRVGYAF